MNVLRQRFTKQQAPAGGRSRPTGPASALRALTVAAGLVGVLAGGPPVAWGATFPLAAPTVIHLDDFEVDRLATDYTVYQDPGLGWSPDWSLFGVPPSQVAEAKGGVWGDYMLRETQAFETDRKTVLVINRSMPGDIGYDPVEWAELQIEIDISPAPGGEQVGIAWGVHDDDGDGDLDRGYYFYFDGFPDEAQALAGARARWHLVRHNVVRIELGSGPVELNAGSGAGADRTMTHERMVYRVRLKWFCNNFQVEVMRLYNPPSEPLAYRGCGGPPSPDPDRWCTVTEWIETGISFTPGMVGPYAADNDGVSANHRFDNLTVSSWTDQSCDEVCTEWLGWQDTTASHWNTYDRETTLEKFERLEFKFLYDAALHDYGGVNIDPQGRVDNDVFYTVDQRCNGWSLAVDLPPPNAPAGDNVPELQAFLQPMSTAIDLIDDEGGPDCDINPVLGSDDLCWQDSFDSDPASLTYDPIPFVTFGATPIKASLDDAYDWYYEKQTVGLWAEDPLAECRRWYLILITDGEEQCDPDAFSGDCSAADNFAEVGDTGLNVDGLLPVPIFTIGFAGGFTLGAEPPVACLSTRTDGDFRVARDAQELADVLFNVVNRLDERDRSFVPFKVSPPPSSLGGHQLRRDFLAVFPFFVPREGHAVWPGSLYAFALSADQPRIPATGDCEIDFDQVVWEAGESLAAQVAPATPVRDVYMGLESAGIWSRHDLADIRNGGDASLRDSFRDLLDWPVAASDLQVQEVVNYLRYDWVDNDGDAGNVNPQHPPKAGVSPGGRTIFDRDGPNEEATAALGDIYHSQPVIVSPPATSMYVYDYGFVASGERGAHNYIEFMELHAKRRRVTGAGANDGLFHVFDAGFYDRDETDFDDQHDLGNGNELFAYVPQAVFGKLFNLTYGTEQQYLVDGPVTVADVFISPDGGSADPEWRTVALVTMRRGGRGVAALDITQPDPYTGADNDPTESVLPGCADGTACDGDTYPNVLWEFADTSDDDSNCPPPRTGDECRRWWDLGWTWSKPAVARIAIYNGSDPTQPDDQFVAFFGGGWDRSESDATGHHVYGVDIETGDIVFKESVGVSTPGSVTALDSDVNGFHDRVYFGDTDGGIWRISYPAPDDPDALGVDTVANGGGATMLQIFDLSGTSDLRLQFFARPVTVPAVFDDGAFEWALAVGSGDRANLQDESAVVDVDDNEVNNFFFLLDVGDSTTRTASDLVPISYVDLGGEASPSACAGVNALDTAAGNYGWYLSLRANEKVNFEATVINGHVLFPTFEPTDDPLDGAVDQCGGASPAPPAGTPTPEPTPEPTPAISPTPVPGEELPICSAAGVGRAYDLWFTCGQGEESGVNDIITGVEDYTIDGTTYVTFTVSEAQPGMTEEFLNFTGYAASNWRQD
jgi:hypothetical protein